MATVTKDFKIKSGLIVEGTSATVNNYDIITKSPTDQSYITSLVGGSSESANTPDTIVLRDANGDFAAGTITAEDGFAGNLTGNVTGAVTGNVTGDLTGDVTGNVTGNVTGDVTGDLTGNVTGNVTGDVTGDVTGNLTGNVTGNVTGDLTGNVTGNLTGDVTGTVSDISNHDTDDVAEGLTNLYFTDARAQSAMAGLYDPAGSASAAQTAAESYTDSLIGDGTVDGTAGNTVADRISTAVANLVDSAPAALDTLNELAAALGDDANFVTTITTSIGEKVAKAGDTMTGALTLPGAPTSANHAATKQYVDDAESAANTYTDGEITSVNGTISALDTDDIAEGTSLYFTDERAQDAVAAAIAAGSHANITISYDDAAGSISFQAENGVADSDTDDLTEGATNLYFTDERAQDAVATAIAAGTHANITITYDDANNTISFEAENGVADSTTDDLTEGSSNLYFTDARAVTALEAVVPNFTEVDINSVATQVAATQTVATASQVVGYSFDSGTYRSAKFLVKIETGTHTEVSEVLITLDSSDNIAITEFAVVGTNGSLSTITAGMNGTDVELLVTTAENSSDVTVMGTLLV